MADKLRWNELPVNVRRSKHLLYNYLAFGELPTFEAEETAEDDEPGAVDIQVSVTDGTNPVGQVQVSIGDITGTTGLAGGCKLSNVPLGAATVNATKEGFEEYSKSIVVTAETTSLEIELTEI